MTAHEKIKALTEEGSAIIKSIDPLNGKPKHSDVRKLKRVFRRLSEILQSQTTP